MNSARRGAVLVNVWMPRLPSAAAAVLAALLALTGGGAVSPQPAAAAPPPAAAQPPAGPPPPAGACVLVFPLPMRVKFATDFGDPRGRGRKHEGIDMMAPKMTPVFAVAPGEIAWLHDEQGGRCCDIEVHHDDGWRSRYIHLNNDTPGTDDGQGYGIADDVRKGSRVQAGQLIGWVGDSGNAEEAGSHLHFELRDSKGRAVDPHEDLTAVMPAAAPPTAALAGP